MDTEKLHALMDQSRDIFEFIKLVNENADEEDTKKLSALLIEEELEPEKYAWVEKIDPSTNEALPALMVARGILLFYVYLPEVFLRVDPEKKELIEAIESAILLKYYFALSRKTRLKFARLGLPLWIIITLISRMKKVSPEELKKAMKEETEKKTKEEKETAKEKNEENEEKNEEKNEEELSTLLDKIEDIIEEK